MHADAAAKRFTITETRTGSHDRRCAQCGEPLVIDRNKARPDRELCVDCAFDTIPCTD